MEKASATVLFPNVSSWSSGSKGWSSTSQLLTSRGEERAAHCALCATIGLFVLHKTYRFLCDALLSLCPLQKARRSAEAGSGDAPPFPNLRRWRQDRHQQDRGVSWGSSLPSKVIHMESFTTPCVFYQTAHRLLLVGFMTTLCCFWRSRKPFSRVTDG